MNPAVALLGKLDSAFPRKSRSSLQQTPGRPTILIATVDPQIREALANLLESAPVNAIWVSGVKDVKTLVTKERIAACLCELWLQDGTYREVIRHLRRERMDIPTIIVSGPTCPHEYRDYLAAVNLGTLNFLCYPYQEADFKSMLESAIGTSWPSADVENLDGADFRERGAA